MNRGQFSDASHNVPGYRKFWFRWTMTSATAFTINLAAGLLAGTAAIVRTGAGVYDIFPEQPPGVNLIDWWFDFILVTPTNVALGGTGNTTVVNNLVASSKVTATIRNQALTATDLVTSDIVYGWIGIQTVSI